MKIWGSVLALGISGVLLNAQAPSGSEPQTNAKVGQQAPDFTLPSTTGKDVTLSDFRGKKNVVLAFIVKAFTGG